ncbi:reverse transcriptase domain-containing protein [Paenibacillus sp. 2003]|uniref:reverse transcriptase domain-containing protein n=1 Tax=Paenibacillus TaxID=44249 RepID=UPI002858CCB4|nr:reverse transcriptase domain-containing protein [Paenibacillus sp. 2003]MDR6720112.1 retron-type reverse transcriptase [Paenibacillus sp. 2003]
MSASKEYNKLFTINGLSKTFETYIKFNTAAGIDKINYDRFVSQKDDHFEIINHKVIAGAYKFTPYKERLIIKSKYSLPRVISIPTIRDKIVLKNLHLILSKTFDVHQHLPQKYLQDIKDNLQKYDSFLKIDLSNFFGTLKHGILLDKLKLKIRKKEILELIHKAITTPNFSNTHEVITEGVPQGLPISNILSHIYINELDKKFESLGDIMYLRYVDDILIFCQQSRLQSLERQIIYEIEAILNLRLNNDKTKKGYIDVGFDYLGYSIELLGNGQIGLKVKEAARKKFENSLVRLFTEYKYSKEISPKQFIFRLNNKITGSISSKVDGDETREHKYGWLFYYSQMDDIKFLYHLDWFINKLLNDFSLKHIDRAEIKSFVKAFYEIKYNIKESEYIHRPDMLSDVEKRRLLIEVFNIHNDKSLSLNHLNRLYYKWVYKPIKEFEKDIQKLKS